MFLPHRHIQGEDLKRDACLDWCDGIMARPAQVSFPGQETKDADAWTKHANDATASALAVS